jgi:hypothetical protein
MSIALQRHFTLLRHFEYYYDVSAVTVPHSSYTYWRLALEGDRHEKDHAT